MRRDLLTSGWKPTHLTSVNIHIRTSVFIAAWYYANSSIQMSVEKIQMLDGLVSTHPFVTNQVLSKWLRSHCFDKMYVDKRAFSPSFDCKLELEPTRVEHFMVPHSLRLGQALGSTSTYFCSPKKKTSGDKHSSLFRRSVVDKGKKGFITLTPDRTEGRSSRAETGNTKTTI